MSQPTLEIILDHNDDHSYPAGSNISGVVRLTVEKVSNFKELYIERIWKTHGQGNADKGNKLKQVLHAEAIEPGTHEFPFTFTIPTQPVSYHGEYINIDWYLSARADISWNSDPKCELDFLVVPNEEQIAAEGKTFHAEDGYENSATQLNKRFFLVPLILFFLIAVLGVTAWFDWDDFPVFRIFLIIPLTVFFLLSVKKIIKNNMIHKRLGDITYAVSTRILQPGDTCAVAFSFHPQIETQLNNATFKIIASEKATSGSGKNSNTLTKVVWEKEVVAHEGGSLPANEKVSTTALLTFPTDVPFSFDASNNKVQWSLIIYLDIARCPDWKKEMPLRVTPFTTAEELAQEKEELLNPFLAIKRRFAEAKQAQK